MKPKSKVLIIAGSDSSGGAGIQADIKTVTSLGSYAMTAITAVTSQNSTGVKSIFPIDVSISAWKVKPSDPYLFFIIWNLPVPFYLSSVFLDNEIAKSEIIIFE